MNVAHMDYAYFEDKYLVSVSDGHNEDHAGFDTIDQCLNWAAELSNEHDNTAHITITEIDTDKIMGSYLYKKGHHFYRVDGNGDIVKEMVQKWIEVDLPKE